MENSPHPIFDKEEVLRRTKESEDFFHKANASVFTLGPSVRMPNVKFDGSTERNGNYHTTDQIKDRVASCREAYENSGIIGNAIDLMVDFALEDFDIVHHNPSIQNFYQSWAERIGLREIVSQILKCYYRDGNVPILKFRGKIKASEFENFQKAVSQKTDGAYSLFSDPGNKSKVVPYAYHVLDFMSLDKDGSELLGNVRYKYRVPAEDWQLAKNYGTASADTVKALDVLKQAIGEDDFKYLLETGFLRMDPNRLTILSYKKDDYRAWANPMFWRVIEDVRFKKLLRDMDVSVCESVINTITIIALGDTKNGLPPTPEMIAKFASLMKTPTKSQTLIWNDLIKIMAEYPPVDKILGTPKYEQVDNDIRAGLGISEVVLNGQGNNYANSYLSVKTLMERLESGRTCLLGWLEGEVDDIASAMGFKQPAWFKMHHMSLRDEDAEKRLLLELVDRGMVSYQTCVERFGENFNIEVERMQREDDYRRKNERKYPFTMVKAGKFGPNIANGPLPILEMLDKQTLDQLKPTAPPKAGPNAQGPQGDKGGKPVGVAGPQQKKATPRNSPVGQKTAASETFERVYSKFDTSKINDSNKDKLFSNIAKIIEAFDSPDKVSKDKVLELSKSKYTSSFFPVYEKFTNPINGQKTYHTIDELRDCIIECLAISLENKNKEV